MNEKNDDSKKEMSRRDFLKGAAMIGAAMGISPLLTGCAAKVASAGSPSAEAAATHRNGKMPHRTLGTGKASFEISALGFGCMGLSYNRSFHPDKKMAIALVHEAVERGVTLFDTAESYGPWTNEILMGEALQGYSSRVYVTSKFGHKFANGKRVMAEEDSSPANIRKVCEASLRHLKMETLGMFYQHRADPRTPIEEVAQTIKELIQEGKVLHFGLCEVNAATIRRAHAIQPITAIQSEYHLMHRTPENNILPLCRELGIGFVPYSPLNRGLLGGDINEYTQFDRTNDNRHTLPRFTPEAIRANLKIVNVLQHFGRTRGITAAQVALAWLLHKEPWIVPIPGTTKLSHLEENIRAIDIRFSDTEIAELEQAVAAIPVTGSRYNAEQEAKVQK